MPSPRIDVISIGTLDRNLLWKETRPVRTPHATCTLVRAAGRGKGMGTGASILVDPGLPPLAMKARLEERVGPAEAAAVSAIFLTSFRPPHRMGVGLYPDVPVYLNAPELAHARAELDALRRRAREEGVDAAPLDDALRLLDRAKAAEDVLAPQVDLFPLPGYTRGTAGLLVSAAASTTLIAGPAVPTREHFLAGQLSPDVFDQEQAAESLREAYEIADVVVPGFDNLFLSPRGYGA